MPIRRQVRTALERTLGKQRTNRLRRAERDLRRKAAIALDPAPRPAPPPAPKPKPAPQPKPAPKPEPVEKPSSEKTPAELASRPPGGYRAPDPFAEFTTPVKSRHDILRHLHEVLAPRTYLETGVADGASMTLSRCLSIGVDPAFKITKEIHCDVHLVRDTSDAFFAREDALAHFEGRPIDLAFIDGMHLAEFALRDFMNVEKHMSRAGVVLVDDMLPRNPLEAARDRRTSPWTGDVYKLLLILADQRPDLRVTPLNTSPTGTVLITGLDPSSTVLTDRYEENLQFCLSPDPQQVPDRLLHRTDALLDITSDVWAELAALRDSGDAAAIRAVVERLPGA